MAVHLIGGGWAEDESGWTGLFLAEAARYADHTRGRDVPRVVVVLWAPTDAEGRAWHEEYRADFARLGPCHIDIVQLTAHTALQAADLDDADGIFIGGGHTPSYHAAVLPARAAIQDAVAGGVPYAGYSAGAMIAGSQALVGGWQIDGTPVCPEAASEGLSEVSLGEGLGLVDAVVDVHCAQLGLLGRSIALVEAGLAARMIAVDECTSAIWGTSLTAAGTGRVWEITGPVTGGGVTVAAIGHAPA